MGEHPIPPEVHEMRAGQLDLALLGHAFLNLPLVANQLGHSSLAKTDIYLHPVSAETQFAVDLLALARNAMKTEMFCEKWFEGEAGAALLLGRIQEGPTPSTPAPPTAEAMAA